MILFSSILKKEELITGGWFESATISVVKSVSLYSPSLTVIFISKSPASFKSGVPKTSPVKLSIPAHWGSPLAVNVNISLSTSFTVGTQL